MTSVATRTRILLLIEDEAADAVVVKEMLSGRDREAYHVLHESTVTTALRKLRDEPVDIVLLDLGLPDCAGVESVRAVRDAGGELPIVVLTGLDDEDVALACIDAGAQDYLVKGQVTAQDLRRALGYAITRVREAQLRELQTMLEHYRSLSSATQGTTVTAALAGSGAIALRNPEDFERIVTAYYAILEPFRSGAVDRLDAPRDVKEHLITRLGDHYGGPRDLLDVHVAALERALARGEGARTRLVVLEARLLALEMMGMLVDYYRVGNRRRYVEGASS